jgi:C4-dicarboxylate transporter DctM subunit
MLPAMRSARYPESFSAGLITAVGAIDIIIPPSIPMIIYGMSAEESVPRLYAAGVLPGLLIAGLLAGYVFWYARRTGMPAAANFDPRVFGRALVRGVWALGAPVIILGGIYGGVFSPVEAAGVACVYAALVTRLVYRELSWREVIDAAATTALLTAQVLIIVACASVFSWVLTVNQVPAKLVQWIQAAALEPWSVLAAINVLLLVVGCFIDPLSAILVLTPLLVPVVKSLGIDTVHFGLIVTEPRDRPLHPAVRDQHLRRAVGAGTAAGTIYRGIGPFLALYLVALVLITYVPQISLWSMRLFLAGM